jgi:hypothetical protein
MEVPGIPALMTVDVKINKRHDFIHRGTTVGCLGKALVGKSLKAAFFVTVNIAAKGAITYTKNQGCLFLCQAVFSPTAIGFFESHAFGLL